jgi:hypothetical protein
MPEIRFTQEDLNERKPLTPGWRTLEVMQVSEGPGKKDPSSTTYPMVLIVRSPEADAGTRLRVYFNEKIIGRIIDYLKCFVPGGNLDPSKTYRLEDTVGYHVDGYCLYNIETGFNEIKDWRPATAKKGA